jgi:hypothetical protein
MKQHLKRLAVPPSSEEADVEQYKQFFDQGNANFYDMGTESGDGTSMHDSGISSSFANSRKPT